MGNPNLKQISNADLEAELARRKKEKEAGEVPTLLATPDLTALRAMAENHIKSIASGEYHEDNDDAHYMYEAVLKAFYGPNVFKWINKKV